MKKRLNWVFPVLFLEGPNINVESIENIVPISKENMLDGIRENGTKCQEKNIKDFQLSLFFSIKFGGLKEF